MAVVITEYTLAVLIVMTIIQIQSGMNMEFTGVIIANFHPGIHMRPIHQ